MSLQIPTIDISSGLSNSRVIAELRSACEDWGFFQIIGHDVDPALRANLFSSMAEFFQLPSAAKLSLSRSEENYWGYYDKELTKNKIDCKEIFDIDANLINLANPNTEFPVHWPSELPLMGETSLQWIQQCENLSQSLVSAICTAMDTPAEALNPYFGDQHSSFLRFNYYPCAVQANIADKDSNLGIHPHTDAGALTVLAQDEVPGLQVNKGGAWHTVVPAKNSFIINIGDMMQVWSNDRFVAPEHRVLASGDKARFSAPYFYNPSYSSICAPLVEDPKDARYKPISWDEFRNGRAAGDYANQGEEIQISWFKK